MTKVLFIVAPSRSEAVGLCRLAFARFYFRPSLVRRHLVKAQSRRELYRKTVMSADLLKNVVLGSSTGRLDRSRPVG